MRKVVSVLCLFILVLAGCSKQETVTGPELLTNHQQILPMPEDDAPLAKKRRFKQEINGITGGQIDFATEYRSKGQKVKVYGSLVIPAGAFDYTTKFTVNIDKRNAAIELYPSPLEFNIPLELTLTYEGIDLKNIDPEEIDFYYIEEKANYFELVNSAGKIFDAATGTLGIIEAEINHFSRYGWVN